MDAKQIIAMQKSLEQVRDEVHQSLAKLDAGFRDIQRTVETAKYLGDKARNAAYEALAEVRHLTNQLDELTSAANTTPSPETHRETERSRRRGDRG